MKKIVVIILIVLLLVVVGYYGVYFYKFAKGVKADTVKKENKKVQVEIQLNDTTVLVIDTLSK